MTAAIEAILTEAGLALDRRVTTDSGELHLYLFAKPETRQRYVDIWGDEEGWAVTWQCRRSKQLRIVELDTPDELRDHVSAIRDWLAPDASGDVTPGARGQ